MQEGVTTQVKDTNLNVPSITPSAGDPPVAALEKSRYTQNAHMTPLHESGELLQKSPRGSKKVNLHPEPVGTVAAIEASNSFEKQRSKERELSPMKRGAEDSLELDDPELMVIK